MLEDGWRLQIEIPQNDPTMTSANFAAAQERVLERRRLREEEARSSAFQTRLRGSLQLSQNFHIPFRMCLMPGCNYGIP